MHRDLYAIAARHGISASELDTLTPTGAAHLLDVLEHGGIRGGDGSGDEPTPAERVDALHQTLSDEGVRSRLSDTEIGEFSRELSDIFRNARKGEVESIGRNDTERLQHVAECIVALAAEAHARYLAAADSSQQLDELERMAGLASDVDDGAAEGGEGEGGEGADAGSTEEGAEGGESTEGEGEAEGGESAEGGEGEGGEAGAEGVQAGATAPLAVPSLRELNARPAQPGRRDVPVVHVGTEAGEIRWIPTNEMISLAEFTERVAQYDGRLPVDEKIRLGRRPTLADNAVRINSREDSPEVVSRKLEQAVAGLLSPRAWDANGVPTEGIQASGGWGTPTPVVYDIDTLAVADRPVRAALPSVGVDRGGLTWVRQPKLSDIVTGGPGTTNAAVGIWTPTDDESASDGSPVKSHQHPGNPTTVTVQLDALYMSLENGVLQSRAFPEWVAAWGRLTEAAYARMAETYLLDHIEDAEITKNVSQGIMIGATRDYFSFMIILAAAERNRQRMRPDAVLRALYPAWLIDMLAVDMVRSGTNFVDSTPQIVARNYLETSLRAANINASWYMDSSTDGDQLLPAQADNDDINEFPTTVRSYLFHEGAFVVGDGGMFDAGVIRDSDLVETNDFRQFNESFEAVFDRGQWAYTFDTDLCPSGTSAAAVDIQHLCTTGS